MTEDHTPQKAHSKVLFVQKSSKFKDLRSKQTNRPHQKELSHLDSQMGVNPERISLQPRKKRFFLAPQAFGRENDLERLCLLLF